MPDERLGERICAAYTGSASVADVLEAFDELSARGELPRRQVPRQLRGADKLPLLGPGKLDRAAVRELF